MTQPRLFAILVGVFAVLFILGLWLQVRKDRRRSQALAVAARRHGLACAETAGPELLVLSAGFESFGQHDRWRNVMTGMLDGVDTLIGDYPSPDAQQNSECTFDLTIAFQAVASTVPDFTLEPESLLHKLGQLFGYQDLDFPDNLAFSQQNLLRVRDEVAARRTFHPELRNWFVRNPGWTVRVYNQRMALYRADRALEEFEFPELLRALRELRPLLNP